MGNNKPTYTSQMQSNLQVDCRPCQNHAPTPQLILEIPIPFLSAVVSAITAAVASCTLHCKYLISKKNQLFLQTLKAYLKRSSQLNLIWSINLLKTGQVPYLDSFKSKRPRQWCIWVVRRSSMCLWRFQRFIWKSISKSCFSWSHITIM